MRPRKPFLIIALSVLLLKGLYACVGGYWYSMIHDAPPVAPSLEDLSFRFDSFWYKAIAENGYPEVSGIEEFAVQENGELHQSLWGFMPGYPLLVKANMELFQSSFEGAAVGVAFVFSLLFPLFFYAASRMVLPTHPMALQATLLTLVFPFGFYTSVAYSEGPFLNCMSRDHMKVELKYFLAAIQILEDPEKAIQMTTFFSINHKNSNLKKNPKTQEI